MIYHCYLKCEEWDVARTKFYLMFPVKMKISLGLLIREELSAEMDLRIQDGEQGIKSRWWLEQGCFLAHRPAAGREVSRVAGTKSSSMLECMCDVGEFPNLSGSHVLCWQNQADEPIYLINSV